MTVVTKMGRITAVVPTASKRPANGAEEIDATGHYVVPGYNDMHSHVLELADPSGSLALMLAEGVTGFRQMSGSPALLAKRKAGMLPIGRAAPLLLETPGAILSPLNAGTPEAVREEVRRQQAQGADFVKMAFANPDCFFAAVEEGRRIGIPVLGHLQEGTDPNEATARGLPLRRAPRPRQHDVGALLRRRGGVARGELQSRPDQAAAVQDSLPEGSRDEAAPAPAGQPFRVYQARGCRPPAPRDRQLPCGQGAGHGRAFRRGWQLAMRDPGPAEDADLCGRSRL